PKHLAGDVGSLRGTTQNLASAVGTAVMGAVLVMVLGVGIGRAVVEHPELPEELVAQVDLDQVNYVSNDELYEVLSGTTATEEQVRAAVELNEEQRLRTLKTGFLILAGLSAAAALPASRLPKYVPGEIRDPETAWSECVQPARSPAVESRSRKCHGKDQPLLICSPLCAAAASEANTSPYSAPEVPRVLSDTG